MPAGIQSIQRWRHAFPVFLTKLFDMSIRAPESKSWTLFLASAKSVKERQRHWIEDAWTETERSQEIVLIEPA